MWGVGPPDHLCLRFFLGLMPLCWAGAIVGYEVDEFLAAVNAQLGVDVFGMGGCGLTRDDQRIAHVGDGAPACEQRKYF